MKSNLTVIQGQKDYLPRIVNPLVFLAMGFLFALVGVGLVVVAPFSWLIKIQINKQ